ncbi:MAG TPA: glycosyl hydrolase [Pseudonocardiaceae bacterium]|nr:glycosyl hydrolase [Pseudonocardiaceae bacterium]
MPHPVTRRTLFGLSAAIAAGILVPWADTAAADAGPAPGEGWPQFVRPPAATAPKFRWWWPNGQVDASEIMREVDEVADAHCGGLEVSDVHHSGLLDLDVEQFGWGSPRWLAALEAALSQAQRRGITIDLTIGPSWPAAVPTITPDSAAASCELAHGIVTVAGGSTYSAPVPAPVVAMADGVTTQQLVALQAARITGAVSRNGTPLDPASVVTLTDQVSAGAITWTAPAGGDWALISYWQRGSGQQPEAGPFTTPPAYVVDHFSAAGTRAVTDLWESTILSPHIRRLIQAAGGALFEDSLEIETGATIWTPGLAEAFRADHGYDVLPYLPILVQVKGKYPFTYDAETTAHVRDDLNLTLSNLYKQHHLLALRDWAHTVGLELRVQPYGLPTDSLDFAALLDIPEGESLGFKNLDDYRILAGGRDLAGHPKLSCEAICYAGGAYSTTWHHGLVTIDSFWAAGVNQSVIHGFAYANAPGATWPGFAAFSPYNKTGIGYGEAWGPRQPTWQHVPDIADYMARTQLVLQTGTPKYDLIFYRQKGYTSTGIGTPWGTSQGIPTGWSYIYASDPTLQLPGVAVRDGRLAPDGPAAKAIVLSPDFFTGNESEISLTGAQLLLGFARSGLPVIVYGDWSTPASTGHVNDATQAAVADAIAELLALPNVAQTTDQTQIGPLLGSLGVGSTVSHVASNLMHVHRVAGQLDLYYLANAQHQTKTVLTTIDQTVQLTATAQGSVPYRLDAWTGQITPILEYTSAGSTIGVRIRLEPGESTIVVLAPPGWHGPRARVQVVAKDAESVRIDGNALIARAAAGGSYTITLANGAVLHAEIPGLPGTLPLTQWSLRAEDWQPGARATETVKPIVEVSLDGLVPWSQIPALIDSSGIGHYRADVSLPANWGHAAGAVLDLGVVNDTFRVWVNGRRVPPAGVLTSKLDLGSLLRPGDNVVEVEVATALMNRLRVVTPEIYGVATHADYGLIGPVTLTPYGEAPAR